MNRFYPPITKSTRDLHKACREGNLQVILDFIDHEENQVYLKENLTFLVQMLIYGSMKGHLNICEALWNAPQLNKHINGINNFTSLKNLLSKGFDSGNLEVVKFFQDKLNKKKNVNQQPINYNMNITSGLISASSKGHLEIIKHFFLDESYNKLIDLEYKTNSILNAACSNNQLKILQFLLETNGIKDKYDIHKDNDCLFKLAYENNHTGLLQYFIFNLNIEKNVNIKELLSNRSRTEAIINMFETRELEQELAKELPTNEGNQVNKKLKV